MESYKVEDPKSMMARAAHIALAAPIMIGQPLPKLTSSHAVSDYVLTHGFKARHWIIARMVMAGLTDGEIREFLQPDPVGLKMLAVYWIGMEHSIRSNNAEKVRAQLASFEGKSVEDLARMGAFSAQVAYAMQEDDLDERSTAARRDLDEFLELLREDIIKGES